MNQSKQILKRKSFVVDNSKTVKNAIVWLKMASVIGLLGLILMLSATNDYLFFVELLSAFGIFGLLGFLKFLESK